MPVMRKLSMEQVRSLLLPRRRVDLAPYESQLAQLEIGDWGEIQLEAADRTMVVKRRYTVAAKNLGKRLIYKRPRGGVIPFEVRALTAPSRRAATSRRATSGRTAASSSRRSA